MRARARGAASGLALGSLLAALALAGGCESRDHANPFDPENPDTHGVPNLLRTRAGDARVELAWDLEKIEDAARLRIVRRVAPDGAEEILTPAGLDPAQSAFTDATAQNDVPYEYRLELVLTTGSTQASAWDPATPGTAVPWVADSDGGGLTRLAPDGRDTVLRVEPGLWFLDLSADTLAQTIWSVDYLDGSLYEHAMDGTRLRRVAAPGARAVAVASDGASVWVGSFREGILDRRGRDGAVLWADSTAGSVEDLLTVAGGGVWLVNAEGALRFYRDDRLVTEITELSRPVALAQSGAGRIFVLEHDARRVRRYDPYGIPEGRGEELLSRPTDLCGDAADGVWVADEGRGGLVHLNASLEEIALIPLPGVVGVTLDRTGRRLWAAGSGGVQVLDLEGRVLASLPLGPRPIKVEVLHAREAG